MTAAEPARPATEPVRWFHLVVPILSIPAWILAMILGVAWASQYAQRSGVTPQRLAAMLADPEYGFVIGQLFLAIFYIVFLIVLRLALGRYGRTRMVADYVPVPRATVVLGAVSGAVLAAGVMWVMAYLSAKGMSFNPNPAQPKIMPTSYGELAMAAATIVIIGPYTEELFFRGAFLSWLKDRIGIVLAILVGAIIFGLIHFQYLMFPGNEGWVLTGLIASLGVVTGIWAYATGSLWPAFAAHAAYNGTMVALAMFIPRLAM